MKALEKSPDRRYQTGRELAADLRAAAEGRSPSWIATGAGIQGTIRAEAPIPVELPGRPRRRELEQQAAAAGSNAAVLAIRVAAATEAGARAVARAMTAAMRASAPVLWRWLQACQRGAALSWTAAREAWLRGWVKGPRVRAAMAACLVALLVALAAGGMVLATRIVEAYSETPGQRLKKGLKSIFSELDQSQVAPGTGEVERHA